MMLMLLGRSWQHPWFEETQLSVRGGAWCFFAPLLSWWWFVISDRIADGWFWWNWWWFLRWRLTTSLIRVSLTIRIRGNVAVTKRKESFVLCSHTISSKSVDVKKLWYKKTKRRLGSLEASICLTQIQRYTTDISFIIYPFCTIVYLSANTQIQRYTNTQKTLFLSFTLFVPQRLVYLLDTHT